MPLSYPRTTPFVMRLEAAFGADPSADPAGYTWTDITSDMFGTADVEVGHGRSPGANVAEPCRLAFTLKNGTGIYTPDNANSIRYPYIRQNLPLRFSNNPTGSSYVVQGVAYLATAKSDYSEITRPLVEIEAQGLLGWLRQGEEALQSAIARYTLGKNPVGYWPMEDDSGSTGFASALAGHQPAFWTAQDPTLAAGGPVGSDRLPKLANNTKIDANMTPYASSTSWTVAFVVNVPSAPPVDTPVVNWFSGGTPVQWRFALFPQGGTDDCKLEAWAADGTNLVAGAMSWQAGSFSEPYGENVLVTVTAVQSGGNINWTLKVWHPDFGTTSTSGSFVGTVANITGWQIPNGWDHTDYIFGHFAVFDYLPNYTEDIVDGFTHEDADNRMIRICAEQNVLIDMVGTSDDDMGAQPQAAFSDVLEECAAVDGGVLRDGETGKLQYLCRKSMINQAASLTLTWTLGHTFAPFSPQLDDTNRHNDVEATRSGGSKARVTSPPDIAAHRRYPTSVSLNVGNDWQLRHQAGWRVGLGTAGGMRYPSVTVDLLARPDLITAVQATDIGSRITVKSVPGQNNDIDLLVIGHTQVFNSLTWKITFNCVPYEPFRYHIIGTDKIQAASSTLNGALTATATSFSVATSTGPLWTVLGGDFPQDIDIDGERITLSAISGSSSPQTFTVAAAGRAKNGVVKAHLTGASVYVWRPARIGL